jgi:hypothetical protein
MNFTPEYLKEKTDAAFSLLDEVEKMDIDELKLKPREVKAVYQVSAVCSSEASSSFSLRAASDLCMASLQPRLLEFLVNIFNLSKIIYHIRLHWSNNTGALCQQLCHQ